MTSELRELVCEPNVGSASTIKTSRPASARARAMARPTTPAPMTTTSTRSLMPEVESVADSTARRIGATNPGVLQGLFPDDVATAWGDPEEPCAPLFPEEEALVRGAIPKRQREFRKGRECARRALASL